MSRLLDDVAMLAVGSPRAVAYLRAMIAADLRPAHLVFLHDGGSDPSAAAAGTRADAGVVEIAAAAGIPVRALPTRDVNAPAVVDALASVAQSVIVFAGPSGGILRKAILGTGKRFLHVHPGRLPRFRGSTTIYYSLLEEGTCGATALFLDANIDAGPMIATREFTPPADRTRIDTEYDPQIRSALLVEVLSRYAAEGSFPAEPQAGGQAETYYIVHPVLKHLAILGFGRSGSLTESPVSDDNDARSFGERPH